MPNARCTAANKVSTIWLNGEDFGERAEIAPVCIGSVLGLREKAVTALKMPQKMGQSSSGEGSYCIDLQRFLILIGKQITWPKGERTMTGGTNRAHVMSELLRILGLVTALSLSVVSTVSAQAPQVFEQAPCASNPCVHIGWPDTPPTDVVIRSFTFTLPGPGTAFVDLNGTMQCAPNSWSASGDFGVIDFVTQILAANNLIADANKPSGGRHSMRLITPGDLYPAISAAVNLHTTRPIKYTTGGIKHVFFKAHTLRMDKYTNCGIYNPVFTVLYFP